MLNPDNLTRIDNDVNGNPRYVAHFLNLLTEKEKEARGPGLTDRYSIAVARGNRAGGRKYHNRSYGGGVVFQSYCVRELCNHINGLIARAEKQEKNDAHALIETKAGNVAGYIKGDAETGYYCHMIHRGHILPKKASKFASVGAAAKAARNLGYSV